MKPYLQDSDFTLYCGDSREVLSTLPAESVHMCVTSPPFFGLRDYGMDGQIGLEATPEEWVAQLVAVFEEVRRVLRKDGTLWVECGDSYAGKPGGEQGLSGQRADRGFTAVGLGGGRGDWKGVGEPEAESGAGESTQTGAPISSLTPFQNLKAKDLIGQPFLLAFALREAGWYWRNVCIWHKPNCMPESVRDRFTVTHSYIMLFSKSARYYFDAEAVREKHTPDGRKTTTVQQGDNSIQHRDGERWPNSGRNARSVWTIATEPLKDEHYAAFPRALAERCIKAGTSERGCCPECGAPWVRTDEIATPLGSGPTVDPTRETGRAGMNRQRRDDEGTRPISRFEQRGYAEQLRVSPQRAEMEAEAGTAFAHYIRIDSSGARPIPPNLLEDWLARGWLTAIPQPNGWHPTCTCKVWERRETRREPTFPDPIPCTVLDPFLGSGTTALVSRRLGRRCIGVELNERYCELAAKRTQQLSLEAEVA